MYGNQDPYVASMQVTQQIVDDNKPTLSLSEWHKSQYLKKLLVIYSFFVLLHKCASAEGL